MPACWVTGPIITIDGVNKPKVATLTDGLRDTYKHSSAIYPERGMTWALSYVAGADFVAIDADPDCHRLFDEVIPDVSPFEPVPIFSSRWPNRATSRDWLLSPSTTPGIDLQDQLAIHGASVDGLTVASTRGEWLASLGRAVSAGLDDFRPEGWYTR
ncbi:hypothetical protein LCGC14_0648010 [marine sediment metagenome]|uniref:Uncharacterized protein n=1 Tax=marine sediment metagenome TaxID=412755 RepID=A0A0F9U5H2_9ZZZZ